MQKNQQRVFAITDIHGRNDLFRKALKYITLKKTDKLILLGDIIDRGEDSKGVLDTIFLLLDNGFDVTCLIGNHEKMLLDALVNLDKFNLWMFNGGDKTLSSFLTSSIEKIPTKYIALIKSFKYYCTYRNYILVHASLNMKIENPFSDVETIIWDRNPYEYMNKDWMENRILIHGHNPISQNEILDSIEMDTPIINIDNGVYIKKDVFGSMCVMELNQKKITFIHENR